MNSKSVDCEQPAGFHDGAPCQPFADCSLEKRALEWMAARAPRWVTSDQLTVLGLSAQVGAGDLLCALAL